MAHTENSHPAKSAGRESVPRIDLAKLAASAKKNNKNKNNSISNTNFDSRKPMGNHNRSSSHATPLGLLSPPASQSNVLSSSPDHSEQDLDQPSDQGLDKEVQDPTRLLISPPPEEVLQQQETANKRSKSATSYLPNTTPTASSSAKLPQSKRKRSMAPTLPYASTSSVDTTDTNFGSVPLPSRSEAPVQATPNPKPRKQSRRIGRAHVRNHSEQSDLSMQSVPPSPTVQSTVGSSTFLDGQVSPTLVSNEMHLTPSRKRSQHRLLKSPHANNPDADFIPPYHLPSDDDEEVPLDEENLLFHVRTRTSFRVARRSATPVAIPPYEPPSQVFTPPREVIVSPIGSATKSKRKTKAKSLKLDLHVKKELPDIDLTAPMPPASPTDDPLLLSGPPEEDLTVSPPRHKTTRDAAVFTSSVGDNSITLRDSLRGHGSLPPSSPPDQDDLSPPGGQFQWPKAVNFGDRSTDSMDMDIQPYEYADAEGPVPHFDFGVEGLAETWSDSDDDSANSPRTPNRPTVVDEGIGEFTGRWRQVRLPTKADPPSSATRERIEKWGRQSSPYPYKTSRPSSRASERSGGGSPSPSQTNRRGGPENEEADMTVHAFQDQQQSAGAHHDTQAVNDGVGDAEQEDEVRAMSVEPRDDMEEQEIQENRDEKAQEGQDVREFSMEPDEEEEEEEREVRALSLGPEGEDVEVEVEHLDSRAQRESADEEEDEDEREVREMSMEHDGDIILSEDDEAPSYSAPQPARPSRVESHRSQAQPSPAPLRDLSFLGRGFDTRRSSTRVSASFERARSLFGARPSPVKSASALPDVSDDEDEEMPAANVEAERVPETSRSQGVDASEKEGRGQVGTVGSADAAEMSSGDESDDPELEDPGLVQITSADPKAAARAAAILKQHDYDCFTKIVLKQQQQRNRNSPTHSALDELKRGNRRKTLAGAGVVKGKSRATPRRSLGTVIGDKVYIPGSPVITLGGLLKEAEERVQSEQEKGLTPRTAKPAPSSLTPPKDNTLVGMGLGERAYQTPLPTRLGLHSRRRSSLANEVDDTVSDEEDEEVQPVAFREWTKQDWKLLDGCFTDERIETAFQQGRQLEAPTSTIHADGEEILLAGVDLVEVDNVVKRFIDEMGGDEIVSGFGWSRESLSVRAKAIQNKQRGGHVAPPATPYTPRNAMERRDPRPTSMPVPDFTPLGRRPRPAARNPVSLPPPIGRSAPFSNIPDAIVEQPRRKVPATLLAPRYSHLLDEAVAVSRDLPTPEPSAEMAAGELIDEEGDVPVSASSLAEDDHSEKVPEKDSKHVRRKSGLMRLFSYIPGLSKTPAPPVRKAPRNARPGLPLPPPEVLDKPRGPIVTPARPAPPKPKHPKELVNLNHQPVPEKQGVSMIPRRKPKRMVELTHVEIPEERPTVEPAPRVRRSSGSSVKDLIKGFEERREPLEGAGSHQLKRTKSIGDWRKGLPGNDSTNGRPIWKP